MIIDTHVHYIPPDVLKRYPRSEDGRQVLDEKRKIRYTIAPKIDNIDQRIEDMDIAGVDYQVLSCLTGWNAPLSESMEINDALADVVEKYPDRFIGLAHVPPVGDTAAFDELERAVSDLGMSGVAIMSQVEGMPLDSPELFPFYEKVAQMKLPLYVHLVSIPMGYEYVNDYGLTHIMGRPLDLTMTTARLIYGGIVERFPDMRIIMGCFGGGISSIRYRIEHFFQGRFHGKEFDGYTLNGTFMDYFGKLNFEIGGVLGWIGGLKCALNAMQPSQLLFGSDYPAEIKDGEGIKRYIEDIRGLSLDDGDVEAILGENAARLFGV